MTGMTMIKLMHMFGSRLCMWVDLMTRPATEALCVIQSPHDDNQSEALILRIQTLLVAIIAKAC